MWRVSLLKKPRVTKEQLFFVSVSLERLVFCFFSAEKNPPNLSWKQKDGYLSYVNVQVSTGVHPNLTPPGSIFTSLGWASFLPRSLLRFAFREALRRKWKEKLLQKFCSSFSTSAAFFAGFGSSVFQLVYSLTEITGWWFQTIWKIWVTMGIFPKFRGEK